MNPANDENPTLFERLQRLEAHLAHVERQNDSLNAVVIEQGRELARMKKLVERLRDSFEAQDLDGIRSNNPPPPHHGR